MKIRSIVSPLLIMFVFFCSSAFGKKEPKEYVEGTVVGITRDSVPSATIGGSRVFGDESTRVYTIEAKDGEYEAREMTATSSLFKPLQVSQGDKLQFRVHPKGRLIYVPLPKGEKILEVVKFHPK